MSGLFGGGGGGQNTVDPVIGALNVQTSTFGMAIPIAYGQNRLSANLIWYGDFTAIPHTTVQSGGGKGGGVSDSSNTTFTYTTAVAMGLCEGTIGGIGNVWAGKNASSLAALGLTAFTGMPAQSTWGYLTTNHPTQAIGYSNLAYVATSAYNLGSSPNLPSHSFEVSGVLNYSPTAGVNGAKPDLMVSDYLTNSIYGVGFISAQIGSLAQYNAYCMAAGILLSPVYANQAAANTHIDEVMVATNSGVVWSEGLLKVIPYGDTAITGAWGTNYTPVNAVQYDLNDDDFISSSADPIIVTRKTQADAFNQVQVEYLDAANQYNVAIATASDIANIQLYGLRPQQPITLHGLTSLYMAQTAAQFILQRALYIRNIYTFTVGMRYCLLEPMDIITITDAALGLNLYPVRIIEIDESVDGLLTIIAEDFLAGVSHANTYPSQTSAGYQSNFNTDAGNVIAPYFFEMPIQKTSRTGLAVGVAVTGNNVAYGGCQVWASNDASSYKKVGEVHGGARYGTSQNAITAAVNQVLNVNLMGNGGQVTGGSATDASNLSTLVLVGDELVSYQNASLLGVNQYALTLPVRGAYSTFDVAHPAGEKVVRLDDAIFQGDDLDFSMIGQTLYFKFLSFNIFGFAIQNLATVTAYQYTVRGNMIGLPPSDVASITSDGTKLIWPNITDRDLAGYHIKFQYGINYDWGTATFIHNGLITNSPYVMQTIPYGLATVMIKAVDTLGNESLNAANITLDFGLPVIENVFDSYDYKANSWAGTITNGSIVSGNIVASQSDPFYGSGLSNFYKINSNPFYNSNYDALEWDSANWSPPSADIGKMMALLATVTGVSTSIQYRTSGADTFFGADASAFYSATGTTPFYAAIFTSWLNWSGTTSLIESDYQFKVTSNSGVIAGVISQFMIQVDSPTIIKQYSGVSISSSGTRLTGVIGAFAVINNIQLTLISGSTAVKLEVVDKSASLGPLVVAKDSSGTQVSAIIDALIQGY